MSRIDASSETDFDGLSERDYYIKTLNHEGYSTRKISLLLKERYNIVLSTPSVQRHLSTLRQDLDNEILVNFEPAYQKPKEEGKWYKVIARTKQAIKEYTKLYGFKPSSRAMYYQLSDEHLLTRSKGDQGRFTRATVEARLGWIDSDGTLKYPQLDIDCFADDDTRLSYNGYLSYDPKEPTEPGTIEDSDKYISGYIRSLKASIRWYNGRGTKGEDGRIGGRWYNQSEYVEVWEEKTGLFEAFKSMLSDKAVDIRANKGYPSLIFLYKCSQGLKEKIDTYDFDPESIHILYCGDWDPSGENIDWYIRMRLKQLGIEGVHFERVAVTPEQIDKYNLPLLPIDKQPDKKTSNPNMEEFKRRYGNKATHLDAFFTKKRLNRFKEIIRKAVDEYWDSDIYQEMVNEYDIAANEPEEMDDVELETARNRMCFMITETFRPGWARKEYEDLGLDDE